MPITPANATPIILGQLILSGCLGPGSIKIAAGVTAGLMTWLPSLTGIAITTGTLAPGVGTAAIVIPPPVLFAALTAGFGTYGLLGMGSILMINGLTQGLCLTFLQATLIALTPTTGVGAGTVKFLPPPAGPAFITGFNACNMNSPDAQKMAMAIGQGLTTTFTALVLPVAVAGAPNIIPGGGPAVAKVL